MNNLNPNQIEPTNIVSEFFSENINYFDLAGCDLNNLFEKLNNPKHKANLSLGIPGIEHVEQNRNYIKLEQSSLVGAKIVKFEKGSEKEENFKKLVKARFYIFENFIAALGDAAAIKNSRVFLSELLTVEIEPLIPVESVMLDLKERFITIESVTCERIRHSNIKKITVYGKASDIADFDINFDGYDIAAITGKLNTGLDERRIKISKNGKINFYKHKDIPIYIEHLKFGFKLLTTG
ncbi:MAG: hypothetical protein ACQESP_01290 [Candidatus Muiribacteriota bacterium]